MARVYMAIINWKVRQDITDDYENPVIAWKSENRINLFESEKGFEEFDYASYCDDVTNVIVRWHGWIENYEGVRL